MMQTTEIAGYGYILDMGLVDIEGDLFRMTIPSDVQWRQLMQYLRENQDLLKNWNQLWTSTLTNQVFCQTKYQYSNKLFYKRYRYNENPNNMCHTDVSVEQLAERVSFLPVLIPLNFDETYDNFNLESEIHHTKGGTFYADDKPIRVGQKLSYSLMNARTKPFRTLRISDTWIPEHKKNTNPFELSWLWIGGAYICSRPLVVNMSLEDINEAFRKGR